jgi:hypothetical protein
MITTVLIGLGSGYFLWGTRVARLTEALNGLTLEIDTMRARLANPQPSAGNDTATRTNDELRVINEGVAAVRQELAEQKPLLEKVASVEASTGAASSAELSTVKSDLAACIADKLDLQSRCTGGGGAATGGAGTDAVERDPTWRQQPTAPPAYRPAPLPTPPAPPPAYRPY